MTDLTRIDDGPVATVYSGIRAGVPVAVKVFPKRFDKRTMSAFTKEQSRLSRVRRTTSILMVDGVEKLSSGESALRMDLCTQSLAGLVEREGPLPAMEVIILGRAVADALSAAHSVGVIHGGISPGNILFREGNEPVVADFGITLRRAFARDLSHAMAYLAPESLRSGILNEQTDLYGLGAVLQFALTGRSLRPGEPVPAINRADVPVALSTLIARLLSTSPQHRPGSASEVTRHLTAMLPTPPRQLATEHWDDFDPSPPPSPWSTHRPVYLPTSHAPTPPSVVAPLAGDTVDLGNATRELSAPAAPRPLPLAPPPVPAGGPRPRTPVTVAVSAPRRPGVVLGGSRAELDFGGMRPTTVLAGARPARGTIRYDLLAAGVLVLAVLVAVPLVLLRTDPDELSGGPEAGRVTVDLAAPTDLTDKVRLTWQSSRDLDFAVVVTAEGEKTRVLLAERNHSMTVDVEPNLKYCFTVQASDGDRVYESAPRPLRGAICRR